MARMKAELSEKNKTIQHLTTKSNTRATDIERLGTEVNDPNLAIERKDSAVDHLQQEVTGLKSELEKEINSTDELRDQFSESRKEPSKVRVLCI